MSRVRFAARYGWIIPVVLAMVVLAFLRHSRERGMEKSRRATLPRGPVIAGDSVHDRLSEPPRKGTDKPGVESPARSDGESHPRLPSRPDDGDDLPSLSWCGEAPDPEEILKEHPLLRGYLMSAAECTGEGGATTGGAVEVAAVGERTRAEFPPGGTLVEVLGRVGLPGSEDLRQVIVVRSRPKRVVVCDILAFLYRADARQDLPLRDGDAILIPQKWSITGDPIWSRLELYAAGTLDREGLLQSGRP